MRRPVLPASVAPLGLLLVTAACGGPAVNPFEKKILEVPRRVGSEDLDDHLRRLQAAAAGERAAALWALSDLGTADPALRGELAKALADPSEELRFAALHALARRGLAPGATGRDLVEPVLQALESDAVGMRAAARDAVAALGSHAVDGLVQRLGAGAARARWNAAAALERLGAEAVAAEGALAAAWARETDAAVQERLAGALAKVGPEGAATLLDAVAGSDSGRSTLAVVALRSAPAPALAGAARARLREGAAAGLRDAVAQLAAQRRDVAELLVAELVGLLADEGPAALDAEDALLAVGEPARAALEGLARQEGAPGAEAARDLLERLGD